MTVGERLLKKLPAVQARLASECVPKTHLLALRAGNSLSATRIKLWLMSTISSISTWSPTLEATLLEMVPFHRQTPKSDAYR